MSFFLIFLTFSILFRSASWGLICMIPNIFPVVAIWGLMGIFGVQMESNLVIMVVNTLGLAVDDTTHFTMTLDKFMKEGLLLKEALIRTVEESSDALVGTTLAFAFSFPAFFVGDLRLYTQVGVFVVASLLIALFADILILPAIFLVIDGFGPKAGNRKQLRFRLLHLIYRSVAIRK